MSDQAIVVVTYAVSYGAIFGYAAYLHLRRRRVKG
jgi:hypothetical protein